MMKLKSKILALLMIVLLVVSGVGCGSEKATNGGEESKNPSSSSNTESNDNGESEGTQDTKEELEFVELTYLALGNVPTNGQLELAMEEWNKILKEEINAHLKIEWVEWADWLTKYNLLMVSGEPIDLITSGDWLDMWANAEKGAFMPLDNLIQYAPLTSADIQDHEWENCKLDGTTYFFPENNYTQYVNHGMYYRGDWAKEFGIEVTDYKSLGDYLQAVKDNKEGVIPFDVNGTQYELFDGWVTSELGAMNLLMIPTGFHKVVWAKSKDDLFNVYSPIFSDEFVDFAVMMKEWGDAGYWREDVLNFKGDTRELFKAGQSGADQHHTQTYRTLRYEMDNLVPGSDIQFFPFASTKKNLVQTPVIHGAMAVGANSQNPERAVMAYEIMRQNEEFYRLFNFGREGVQYIIEDGVKKRPEGYVDAEHEFYTDFWAGREDKFELPTDTEFAGIYDLWEDFNSYAIPDPYSRFIFDRTSVEAELAAISDVTSVFGPAITYGKTGDPVAAVEEYREALKKAGIDKVLEEVQKQMNDHSNF
ncbi:ABC transporter substrate-binding protein [Vallitalea pronyensis]|uniref:ABC transporter substrate-binding protein n=1 Tax=Vallitalea pronyensis TaxID=1348613 RepID=A0A8J8MHL8_9FIRM|nr:DUF3502 domain-containing protein [Vallitalea pronyensis]QUI21601.1 ABC transporter substrate-binding protein [Vallitalea pronyensis]